MCSTYNSGIVIFINAAGMLSTQYISGRVVEVLDSGIHIGGKGLFLTRASSEDQIILSDNNIMRFEESTDENKGRQSKNSRRKNIRERKLWNLRLRCEEACAIAPVDAIIKHKKYLLVPFGVPITRTNRPLWYYMNHSNTPNVVVEFDGISLIVRAKTALSAGTELCFYYSDVAEALW